MVRASRFGEYSDASEIALGNAPPRPIPVRSRSTRSCSALCVKAVANDSIPKMVAEVAISRLRPYRSASGPSVTARINTPTSPALSAGPNSAAGTPRLRDITGASMPITCVSKPSSAAISMQSEMAWNCSRLNGRASITSCTCKKDEGVLIDCLHCAFDAANHYLGHFEGPELHWSVVQTLLPPEPERLLRRTVRKAEKHRTLACLVCHCVP
ncbi:hypothetical protein C8K18_12352 [Paraburkholderia sp. GV068]|nr:hypothetical protein C8K19_12352 [Paraburkholderia sp. GV072]PUA94310.1 hypothetical protein C8K18_12352 [Paraburkholderia sp. GV068]